MNHEDLIQEITTFVNYLGIHTKEIKIIVDTDLHITFVSLRVGGNEELLFTENNNELLRDLGGIFKTLIQKKYSFYKDIIIDVNNINKKHVDYTKEKAQIAVDRVLFFDKPYEFGYLNAYERMIIHTYLKKFPHLVSESQGIGKERRLTLRKQ